MTDQAGRAEYKWSRECSRIHRISRGKKQQQGYLTLMVSSSWGQGHKERVSCLWQLSPSHLPQRRRGLQSASEQGR